MLKTLQFVFSSSLYITVHTKSSLLGTHPTLAFSIVVKLVLQYKTYWKPFVKALHLLLRVVVLVGKKGTPEPDEWRWIISPGQRFSFRRLAGSLIRLVVTKILCRWLSRTFHVNRWKSAIYFNMHWNGMSVWYSTTQYSLAK